MMQNHWKAFSILLIASAINFHHPSVQAVHTTDLSADFVVSLSEVLRAVQLYNAQEFSCGDDTEDGFEPGTGDQSCNPHDADYAPQDWQIDLSELLRVLQMYSLGSYSECAGTEDGFCPGDLVVSGDVQYIAGTAFGTFDGKSVVFGEFDPGVGSIRIYLSDGTSSLFVFDADAD